MGRCFNGRAGRNRIIFAFCLLAASGGAFAALAATPSASSVSRCIPTVPAGTNQLSGVNGAVSDTTGIIVSNQGFWIFDKSNPGACTGNTLVALDDSRLFGTPPGVALYSPRVIYDTQAHRFVIVALSQASGPGDTYLSAIVSKTSSPTLAAGQWDTPLSYIVGTSADTADLPQVGYTHDHWMFTAEVAFGGSGTGTFATYLIEQNKDEVTAATHFSLTHPTDVQWVPPQVLDSLSTAFFVTVDTGSTNAIEIKSVAVPGGPSPGSTITVPTFTVPSAVTQSGGQKLDAGDGRFVGPSIQIGNALWNVQPIETGGHAAFRVYKFDTSTSTVTKTITPSFGGEVFFPTMGTNSGSAGAMAVVGANFIPASGSGLGMVAFTGPNDSSSGWTYTTVDTTTTEVATDTTAGTACNGTSATHCLWGPYSAAVIDTSDSTGTTAWTFNQMTTGTAATDWSVEGGKIAPATAPVTPPLAPIASSATDVGTDTFTANWSASSGASGYQLDVATDSGFASFLSGYQAKDVGNVVSANVSGLSASTTYYYRVLAVATGGSSPYSNTISVTTSAGSAKTAIGPLELLVLSLLAFAGLGARYRRT